MRTQNTVADYRRTQKVARDLERTSGSPEQKLYILARAAHEIAKDAVAKEVAAIMVAQPTREEIHAGVENETYCANHPYIQARQEIEDRYQVYSRWQERLAAEDALVDWARENARRGLGGDRFRQIESAFDAWPKLYGELREKLIDICVRMEVCGG